jgi:co-chaperonin GroES (HSP10)
MAVAIKFEAQENPAEIVFEACGMKKNPKSKEWELPKGYEVAGNSVLLGVWKRPEKTAGGLFVPDKSQDEQANQGKDCVVLALGPGAFVSDANYDFRGFACKVGDWVQIWVYEAKPLQVEGHPCRIANDTQIRMKVPGPGRIY